MIAVCRFFATGFYSGLLPKAPGTWGSIVGLVLSFFCFVYGGTAGLFYLTIASIVLGWYSSYVLLSENFDDTDPSYIVIDEIAGISLTLWITAQFLVWIHLDMFFVAFCFFRIFDIWKPWPISWIDRSPAKTPVTAAFFVMLDDLVAAVPAALLTFLVTVISVSFFYSN